MRMFISSIFFVITSIYALQYTDVNGNVVSMNAFQGKKMLLVNVATNSSRVGQLGSLQQLHQLYGDSVIIIAFPSNSFGHESRTNAEIKQFCVDNYGVTYRIAEKNSVAGNQIQSIYNWLSNLNENGVMNGIVG